MVQGDWMALKLKLRPTDWAVILYNLSLTIFIFTARNKLDNWDYLMASHLIIMLLVWFIAWNNKNCRDTLKPLGKPLVSHNINPLVLSGVGTFAPHRLSQGL